MFEFALETEDQLVCETANQFARTVLRPRSREHERSGVPPSLFAEYWNLGFAAMGLPESLGGGGQGLWTKVLALEELAWGDAAATFALENLSWLEPVFAQLPPAEAEHVAAEFRQRPELRVAFVDGRDLPLQIAHDRVSGSLPFCAAHSPEFLLLRAAGDIFIFHKSAFRCEPVHAAGLEAAGACALALEEARARWTITGEHAVDRVWSYVRIGLGAILVGLARAAHEYALDYACSRVVFGQPIAQHQAPAFLLADMRTAIEAARLMTWYSAKAHELEDPAATALAAAAFLEAADCALFVTREAVQLLGGHGFLRDHPVEKWMRDARILTLLCGARDAALDDLAQWQDRSLRQQASPGTEVAKEVRR